MPILPEMTPRPGVYPLPGMTEHPKLPWQPTPGKSRKLLFSSFCENVTCFSHCFGALAAVL